MHLILCVLLICLSCFDFACCAFDSVCAFDTCHALVIEWTPLIHWTFPTHPNLDQFANMSLYICLPSKVYSIGYCSWKSQIESTWIVSETLFGFCWGTIGKLVQIGLIWKFWVVEKSSFRPFAMVKSSFRMSVLKESLLVAKSGSCYESTQIKGKQYQVWLKLFHFEKIEVHFKKKI